ncbi:hypothetical protein KFK09_015837 [Dendrobium nobile]|uniref:Uncharacterized protein n=1 Tax=Dendrobium nobile TaxID=94219 RepID=A0A8T3B8F4_DENNO|nr:hypothetical protein KFK09_015837 [Dendrobium nobile]
MGSPKDAEAPANVPNSKHAAAAAAATASLPEALPSAWPPNSAQWAASAQA